MAYAVSSLIVLARPIVSPVVSVSSEPRRKREWECSDLLSDIFKDKI